MFASERLRNSYLALSHDKIRKSVERAILRLEQDAYAGVRIRTKLIPKAYHCKNLFKLNLVSGWRMLYTVYHEDEVEVIAIILDWKSHPGYERLMGY